MAALCHRPHRPGMVPGRKIAGIAGGERWLVVGTMDVNGAGFHHSFLTPNLLKQIVLTEIVEIWQATTDLVEQCLAILNISPGVGAHF